MKTVSSTNLTLDKDFGQPYNLTLQLAVNKLSELFWDSDVMFVLSMYGNQRYETIPLLLDQSTVDSLGFTDQGIELVLRTPGDQLVGVEIIYDKIVEIVGLHDNCCIQQTLYYCWPSSN